MLHLQRVLAPVFVAALMLVGAASAHAATIVSPAQDAYINDHTPAVQFAGAATGATVTLETTDGTVVGSEVAGPSGAGTIIPTTAVTIATRAEVTLTVVEALTADDSVDVTVDQKPTLSGTADESVHGPEDVSFDVGDAIPDNAVVLYDGTTEVARDTADSNGTVEDMKPSPDPATGAHHYKAVTVGDDSVESTPTDVVEVSVAPAAPEFADLVDYIQLNQSQPAVKLTGVEPTASKVTLYHVVDVGGVGTEVAVGQTTDATDIADGQVTIAPTLVDGLHSLLAKQTVGGLETLDYQGNNSPISVFVKASAPTLSSNDDGKLTNEVPYFNMSGALQSLGGDGQNTNTVELYIDGVLAGSDGTDGDGAAGVRPASVADGAHTAYAVTRDDLGHLSTARSNEVTFTMDATAPATPTLASPQNGAVLTTNNPQFTLNAEPGASVHLLVDDAQDEGWLTADGNGNATFTLSAALADGAHTLYLYAEDAAGNGSEFGIATITVKTAVVTPPTQPPVVTPPTAPKNAADLDGDGIDNGWLVGGKPAAAPATPKVSVSGGKVKLKLAGAPKGAKSIRIYRADGKGGYKLVKTLKPKSKTFTDAKVKPGHAYKYKTVAVNAKGQQGKASGAVTAKVKKKK